uniref:G protein-coupled receptor n=2 Tax=Caenorhabditis japonica TaxID=281687 RepID=A0A8R1EDK1_CAEJA
MVYCRHSDVTYGYMRNLTETLYHLDISDISYIAAVFYISPTSPNNVPSLNTDAWLAMCQFSIMVGTSMFCVFYLGSRCYSEIFIQLSRCSAQCKLASALQKQLFFALVVQTVIPLCLMYIPVCVFFFCPLLGIDIGVISTFLTHTVTLYPALDPLPNMFIIKSYRMAIREIWTKIKKMVHLASIGSTIDTVNSVHSILRQHNESSVI